MAKPKLTKAEEWAKLAEEAHQAFSELQSAQANFDLAWDGLQTMQSDYRTWLESLEGRGINDGATFDKLHTVCDIDLDAVKEGLGDTLTDIEDTLSEVESVDLPKGFGRD